MYEYVLWTISVLITSLYSFLFYYFKTTTWCRSKTCLVGKTALITGANTGIGYETALDFAKRGARVIIACRNQEKAETAKAKIVQETGNENIVVKIVDLSLFESVRVFAKEINETEERLDILVNNAGIGIIEEEKSDDGLPLVMQVNYFSSFLLTYLLIGLLKKSSPSRVINVSSIAAKFAKFDLDNLDQFTGTPNDYSCSKLCNILFTKELAKKLKGTGVTTYSLHPGSVATEIFRHIEGHGKIIVDFLKSHFFKTSEEGAQTIIYTAVEKGIEWHNGEHFDNCKVVEAYSTSTKPELGKMLWEKSKRFVGLKSEELQF